MTSAAAFRRPRHWCTKPMIDQTTYCYWLPAHTTWRVDMTVPQRGLLHCFCRKSNTIYKNKLGDSPFCLCCDATHLLCYDGICFLRGGHENFELPTKGNPYQAAFVICQHIQRHASPCKAAVGRSIAGSMMTCCFQVQHARQMAVM